MPRVLTKAVAERDRDRIIVSDIFACDNGAHVWRTSAWHTISVNTTVTCQCGAAVAEWSQ